MATDLQTARNGNTKSASKYDSYVEDHLGQARRRIRLLDVAAGGLGFLVLTFAYGLVMAVLDRKLEFSSLTRQVLFALYALGAGAYAYFMLALPLFRRINPYYAARRLEATLPEAKNSVEPHRFGLAHIETALLQGGVDQLTIGTEIESWKTSSSTCFVCAVSAGHSWFMRMQERPQNGILHGPSVCMLRPPHWR